MDSKSIIMVWENYRIKIKKILIRLSAIITALNSMAICFGLWSSWHYPELWGSYDLGDGIYMMDYDKGNIIVYGTNIFGRTCNGGIYLIPSYEMMYNDVAQKREWMVNRAISDENWVLAELFNLINDKRLFAVLSKKIDSESNHNPDLSVLYFENESEFDEYCKVQAITLCLQ